MKRALGGADGYGTRMQPYRLSPRSRDDGIALVALAMILAIVAGIGVTIAAVFG